MLRKVGVWLVLVMLIIALLAGCGSARDGFLKAMEDRGVPDSVAQDAADTLERYGDFEGVSYRESYEAGIKAAISMGY